MSTASRIAGGTLLVGLLLVAGMLWLVVLPGEAPGDAGPSASEEAPPPPSPRRSVEPAPARPSLPPPPPSPAPDDPEAVTQVPRLPPLERSPIEELTPDDIEALATDEWTMHRAMAHQVGENLGLEAIACGAGVDWYRYEGAMLTPVDDSHPTSLKVGDGGAVFNHPKPSGVGVLRGDGSQWAELSWSASTCRVQAVPTALSTLVLAVAHEGAFRVVPVVDGYPTLDGWPPQTPSIQLYLPVGDHELQVRTMEGWDNRLGPPEVVTVTPDGPNRFELRLPPQAR